MRTRSSLALGTAKWLTQCGRPVSGARRMKTSRPVIVETMRQLLGRNLLAWTNNSRRTDETDGTEGLERTDAWSPSKSMWKPCVSNSLNVCCRYHLCPGFDFGTETSFEHIRSRRPGLVAECPKLFDDCGLREDAGQLRMQPVQHRCGQSR